MKGMDPYQRLAMEVIKSAVQDLKLMNKRIARLEGRCELYDLTKAKAARKQVLKFFDDEEWCGFWCDIAGVSYSALMDRVRELIC